MKKIIVIILVILAFFLTNKITNYYKENDIIMKQLKTIENKYKKKAKDAIVIGDNIIPGIKGIILPSRRGVLINSTVEKTSAGAANHISIIKVNSMVSAVQKLKDNDYWVIASDHHAEQNHYEVDYTDMNFALIMGAEHAGISKSLLKLSDFKVKIPMLTNFNSLNVSNATAIILFEYVSQLCKKTRGNKNE